MTQVTLGSEKKNNNKKKKKLTGVHASDPPRSLRLRRSFWKTVSIYPRSAPARCPQGENWLYSDKHSNLFPHVCPLWNFDLLEQSVIFIFLPLSSVQSRPRFCIIDTDIFYSDAKWIVESYWCKKRSYLVCTSTSNTVAIIKVHFAK